MSDGKDRKPDRIIDAEVEPVSPEDAAKPDAPGGPERVDLRGSVPKTAATGRDQGGGAGSSGASSGASSPGTSSPGSGASGAGSSGSRPSSSAASPGAASPGSASSSSASAGRPAAGGAGAAKAAGGGSGGGSTGGPGSGGGAAASPAGGRPRGTVWALVAAVVVLLVLLAGILLSPLVAPWLPQALGVTAATGDLETELNVVRDRVAGLGNALDESRRSAQEAQEQAGQVGELRRTLDDLQKRVQAMGGLVGQMDQLEKQVQAIPQPDTGLGGEVAKLRDRLAQLEQQRAEPDPALQARLEQTDKDLAAISRLSDSIQRRMSGMDNGLNAMRSQTDALDRRLSGMDERIAAAAQPAPQVTDALESLRGRLSGLDRDLAALGERLDGLRSSMEAERTALREAEDRSSGRNRRIALVLTLGQIGNRVDAGMAFGSEAAALPDLLTSRLSGDPAVEEAVAALRQRGTGGVVTYDRLLDSFAGYAAQALRQRPTDAPEPGVWDRIVDSARGLVTVRPVGEAEGDSPGAILARAESALHARDLGRAVAEVEKLSGAPADAMAPWLVQAKERLAVTHALAQLNGAIAAALAPDATGAPNGEARQPAQPMPADPDPAPTQPAPSQPAPPAPDGAAGAPAAPAAESGQSR